MKILTIHADFIEFEAKKKSFKGAEEGIKEGRQRVEECLVVFTAFEKRDENNSGAVVQRYVQEIKNIAQQVSVQNIVLYPYAHLSSNLGNPKMAEQTLKDAQKELADKYNVTRAPFGWYKSFNISCKGHPLSELSREFSADDSNKELLIESEDKFSNNSNTNKEVKLKREYKDELFKFNDKELTKDEKANLTAGFMLAKAVKDLFKESNVGEIGFYHDQAYVDFANVKLKVDDLKRIANQVQKIIHAGLEIEEGSKDSVKFLQQKILNDIGQDRQVYKIEDLSIVPLFNQPFLYDYIN